MLFVIPAVEIVDNVERTYLQQVYLIFDCEFSGINFYVIRIALITICLDFVSPFENTFPLTVFCQCVLL